MSKAKIDAVSAARSGFIARNFREQKNLPGLGLLHKNKIRLYALYYS